MRLFDRILWLTTVPGKLVGWLVLPLIVAVCLTVLAAKLGLNAFVHWGTSLPVLGTGITVNTLADMQWYFFALMSVFGGVYAFLADRHVSVDVVSSHFSERTRLWVRIFGDLVFVLPFCLIITWYGVAFTMTSFASGEGSTYGGLLDRWLIKACIPLGFGLLALAALVRAIKTLQMLFGSAPLEQEQIQ